MEMMDWRAKARRYVCRLFAFIGQGAIECMTGCRIDSRTIKRGTLKQL
jgi:hypothetical protein